MMPWLNYHHLHYFWVIAKEGGVTPACKRLRLSQPTLSGQLRQFEEAIGKPLFERKSKKLVLNETGQLVFDYADSIFKTGRELIDALQNQTVKGRIDLNVGILPTLPKKNVHDILQPVLAKAHVRLSVAVDALGRLLDELCAHRLDMIISHVRAPADIMGVAHYHLARVPVIFVAHKDFRGLKKKFPASLEGQPLFLPTHQSYLRNEIEQYLKKHGVTPLIKGEIQDSELLRVIAASGDGVVTIEDSAVSDLVKSKELVVLGGDTGIAEDFFIIAPDRKNAHPAVEEIIKKYQG
jgi:LysR family transcriptional activator of nhaA